MLLLVLFPFPARCADRQERQAPGGCRGLSSTKIFSTHRNMALCVATGSDGTISIQTRYARFSNAFSEPSAHHTNAMAVVGNSVSISEIGTALPDDNPARHSGLTNA